jgi:hypothetical protein
MILNRFEDYLFIQGVCHQLDVPFPTEALRPDARRCVWTWQHTIGTRAYLLFTEEAGAWRPELSLDSGKIVGIKAFRKFLNEKRYGS